MPSIPKMKFPKVTDKNRVDFIMEYEDGTLSPEGTVALFSNLVKTGMAWQLQGSVYGRPAASLIERGVLDKTGKINVGRVNELLGGE